MVFRFFVLVVYRFGSYAVVRILGLDPGSRLTGFGVIDVIKGKGVYVASGSIQATATDLATRLKTIFDGVAEVVRIYEPTELAIEQVFMYRNADSALKLGQARGAALSAAVTSGLVVAEYMPARIKQAVVGRGNATKEQVQHMVRLLLALPAAPGPDAADALAVALCHCHSSHGIGALGVTKKQSRRQQ
ncbi:crossover junction endodeoxyribonuclease RuvC [Gammaproteobacteria bacterium]